MKKIFILIIFVFIILNLTGCSYKRLDTEETKELYEVVKEYISNDNNLTNYIYRYDNFQNTNFYIEKYNGKTNFENYSEPDQVFDYHEYVSNMFDNFNLIMNDKYYDEYLAEDAFFFLLKDEKHLVIHFNKAILINDQIINSIEDEVSFQVKFDTKNNIEKLEFSIRLFDPEIDFYLVEEELILGEFVYIPEGATDSNGNNI